MCPDLVIEEAVKEDLNDVLALYRDLHRNDRPLANRVILRRNWDEIISNSIVHLFILWDAEVPLACCTITMTPNLTRQGRPYGLIENVVTKATEQSKGYGKQLLQAILEFAWANGCYKVMLMTGRKEQWVTGFYEACGFQADAKLGFVAYP